MNGCWFLLMRLQWSLSRLQVNRHPWTDGQPIKTSSSMLAFTALRSDSWLLLCTVICQPLVLFILCILCHLSLLPPLSRASNNIVPLGVDKCGCCDKKLGEGKMQSVSISSHCQHRSAATGGNQHLIYWCAALRAASADYARCNLETVMVFHLLPSFRIRGDWFVGGVTERTKYNVCFRIFLIRCQICLNSFHMLRLIKSKVGMYFMLFHPPVVPVRCVANAVWITAMGLSRPNWLLMFFNQIDSTIFMYWSYL